MGRGNNGQKSRKRLLTKGTTMKSPTETNYLSNLDVTLPLYTTAHINKLESCHGDMAAGRDLNKTVEGKSKKWVLEAVKDSFNAEILSDRLCEMSDGELIAYPFDGLDDFTLATLAQMLFDRNEGSPEIGEKLQDRNGEALLAVLCSKKGSVLVDYDWLFSDMVAYEVSEADPVNLLMRSLAHNIEHCDGNRVVAILSHLSSLQIETDQGKEGVALLADLIKHDPQNFDVYDHGAISLANTGHLKLACAVAKRGLDMVVRTASRNDSADDLGFHLQQWKNSKREVMGSPIPGDCARLLEEALNTSFYSPNEFLGVDLARKLVPTLDQVPVKQMPTL
jgi:hypothetical protein